jgi:uncharacterized protein (DUF1499 family)
MRSTIGIVAALATAAGPLLAHFAVTRPLVGFGVFALGGLVAVVTGLVSLVQLARGRGLTTGGALGVLAGLAFVVVAARGVGHPRINDFTTDLDDPPAFVIAVTLPQNAGRDLSYPPAFAAVQRECCADLHPAVLPVLPVQAYDRALRLAHGMPAWRVTRSDAPGLALEAVATSALFRFEDDVVIRVRPAAEGGSRVDVRSKSRDGQGDIGANTTRIRQFVSSLEAMK